MDYYLTKERLEEIKIELERLKKEERVKVADRLKKAKEYGDLSENSEYIEAKEEKEKLENRIFELEDMIRNATIIVKQTGAKTVRLGTTIEVKRDSKSFTYTIVGSSEARPEANLISNESPLGRAFLGRKPGDTVEVTTPAGATKYKIVKVM